MKKEIKENWEEELKEIIEEDIEIWGEGGYDSNSNFERLKFFIRQLLIKQEKKLKQKYGIK